MAVFLTSLKPDIRGALAEMLRPRAEEIIVGWFKEICGCASCDCAAAYLDITIPGYDKPDLIFEAVVYPEDQEPGSAYDRYTGNYDDARVESRALAYIEPDCVYVSNSGR